MWVDCRATNCSVLWVLHGQECQGCGRLDAPLPTPEITLREREGGREREKTTKHTVRGRITPSPEKQKTTAAFSEGVEGRREEKKRRKLHLSEGKGSRGLVDPSGEFRQTGKGFSEPAGWTRKTCAAEVKSRGGARPRRRCRGDARSAVLQSRCSPASFPRSEKSRRKVEGDDSRHVESR